MLQVRRLCRIQTWPLPGLRPRQMADPHAAVGSCRNALDTTHAGGPLVRSGRSQAYQARTCRLGGASSERRARRARLRRRLPQARAYKAVGTWELGPGFAQRRCEGHGEAARPAPWHPPEHHSGGELLFCGTCGSSTRRANTFYTDSLNVHRYWTKLPEYSNRGNSFTRRPGDGSGSASMRSGHICRN